MRSLVTARSYFKMCFNVSMAAHSLHYPIDVTDVTIIIVSHFSLVSYTTSHMLEGDSSFATKYKTQPQNSQLNE